MSDDFEREALNNPHVHAAIQAGVNALRCQFSDANIGNTLAAEISVTVVEAVRSSALREVAHLLQTELEHTIDSEPLYQIVNWLNNRADGVDREHGGVREFGLAVDLKRIADHLRSNLP